jgi:hypothetical protein
MFSLRKSKSRSRGPLAAAWLFLSLLSTQVGAVYCLPQDVVGDTTRQIVEGREFVKGYVTDVKEKYQPEAPEYIEARKRYRTAISKYNGWAASVKGAIRKGKVKNIQKDASYKKAADDAAAAAKSFTDYVESKQGAPKGAFAVLGSLADVGIKVWNAYKDRKAKDRAADADAFYEDVKWDQWELLAADDSASADSKGQDLEGAKGLQGSLEEVQLGDPPTGDEKGVGETLRLDVPELTEIETQVAAGNSKGPAVDSKALALRTLELAREYADQHVSRREPPKPTRVKSFLSLYGLGFTYPGGKLVPYCAAGVGYSAARAHHLLAKKSDAQGDLQVLRSELADLTRDYTKTHPSTRVMVSAAQARGNWVSYKERPEQGWLVFYNWSGSKAFPQHVGIVDSVDSTGRILRTVEFNTSNDNPSNGGRVERKTRSVRYVMGYIRTYPSVQAQAANH